MHEERSWKKKEKRKGKRCALIITSPLGICCGSQRCHRRVEQLVEAEAGAEREARAVNGLDPPGGVFLGREVRTARHYRCLHEIGAAR